MTDILVQHDGPIATVVINRPAMRNAISLAMWTELARATQELGKTDSVRAIVYPGAGTVAFASGADISEVKGQSKEAASAARYNEQTATAYSVSRAKARIESSLMGLKDERRKKLRDLAVVATESDDYQEGTRAFLEKRAARFTGR